MPSMRHGGYIIAQLWHTGAISHPEQDRLFNLIKAAPASLKHEPVVILAEGDYIIVHGPILQHRIAGALDSSGRR